MSPPLLIERDRGLVAVWGRDPVGMIHGLATADIRAVTPSRGAYTAFLTAKGRMVADARVFRPGQAEPVALLLDVAPDAVAPLLEHVSRFVPPLFARAEDVSDAWAVVGVYGPGASGPVRELAPGAAPDAPEETVLPVDVPARPPAGDPDSPPDQPAFAAFAARTAVTGDDGWDLFVPAAARDDVVQRLAAGARPASPEALEALRVAAGRPRWGRELTPDVIPLEAGLLDRAISQTKGCYTGQEVIVRILHRGHVNRHLRRLVFEAGPAEPGDELYEPGNPRPRGVVTSAVANDAGALGLGYVRREVRPPAELRVGSPDGPAVRVEALD
jgi:tRNA-modifying protein YgfZ